MWAMRMFLLPKQWELAYRGPAHPGQMFSCVGSGRRDSPKQNFPKCLEKKELGKEASSKLRSSAKLVGHADLSPVSRVLQEDGSDLFPAGVTLLSFSWDDMGGPL